MVAVQRLSLFLACVPIGLVSLGACEDSGVTVEISAVDCEKKDLRVQITEASYYPAQNSVVVKVLVQCKGEGFPNGELAVRVVNTSLQGKIRTNSKGEATYSNNVFGDVTGYTVTVRARSKEGEIVEDSATLKAK